MNDTTWQKAKELFHTARSLPADQRGRFLDEECLNDQALRDQVDELLAFYDSEFLEAPPLMNASRLLDNDNFAPGRTIGRYVIRELIGTGGMGQVFLADDTELKRPVAFKVLHEEVAGDMERVRRFIQEARAASALNHPNILTIYEIGSFEGARFIVSEYVDGKTLRERMGTGLTAAESLEITCQIAAALQAAHAAGIVHRDIKPENIMLRQDGLVKVLDFGLAKLTEADDQPIDPTARLVSRLQTSPGLIMGTVAYMSPEQARGQAVDSRTDLWSLGVVFHEMLTGESPFKGESVTDLVTSILEHDTTALELNTISQELKPICTKALAKDKKARYQTAQDLLQDLQGEKKRMEYAIQPTPFITVSSNDEMKTQLIRRRPTLSAEYIVTGMKRHKYATLTTIILVVASGIGLSVFKYNGATPPSSQQDLSVVNSSTTESDLKISKLPISGPIFDIVISPDGKYVAYLDKPAKGIKLLQLETLAETVLVPQPAAADFWCLSFSPDSKFVYYLYETPPDYTNQIMRVPIQGGTLMPVADNAENGVSFSPDGSTMVFLRDRGGSGLDRAAIVLTNPDGSNERTLAKTTQIVNIPLFSPDGKTLACQMRFKDESGNFVQIMGFSVADGNQQTLSDKKWRGASAAVWLPNGNLVIVARENYSDPMQLWSIPPVGEPRALTSGFINYGGLSATRSGDAMATIQMGDNASRDLWIFQENDARKARRVTTSGEIQGSSAWTPDGRIVTGSDVGGNPNIWMMNADGGGRKQLTHDPGADVRPAVSPDGKYIAFTSNRVKGVNHIFRMDIDGGNLKQLTNVDHAIQASFSPDGKWIYFMAAPDGHWNVIRKVSVNGGEATLVATAPNGWRLGGIDINKADGRLLYGLIPILDGRGQRDKVGILPAKGEATLIDLPADLAADGPRWAPDNRTIALMPIVSKDPGAPRDIWSMPIDGKGKPRQLTDFRAPGTTDPRWSADGKQLLVSRGTTVRNPVLIRNSGN